MSELKAGVIHTPHDEGMTFVTDSDTISVNERETEFYIKSEADKVIAELEESHKMEVEQLLMDIVGLKETLNNSRNARKYWRKEYLIEYKECLHQKYKRCLAMARWCMARYNEWVAYYPTTTTRKMKFLDKWEKRWRAIAKQFKEAN